MAYLGPPGTYGQQVSLSVQGIVYSHVLKMMFLVQVALALALHFDETTELVPCPDIACTFYLNYVSSHGNDGSAAIYSDPASYLVMPLQNTIHGGVTETLDCLLSSLDHSSPKSANGEAGPSRPRVFGDWVLPIRHCLVAKKGVKMEDVKWVRSHEQVSGCLCRYASCSIAVLLRRSDHPC